MVYIAHENIFTLNMRKCITTGWAFCLDERSLQIVAYTNQIGQKSFLTIVFFYIM